ncbi:rRNA maturation RNase YbeY [bacterium]|nr:rRNA maturation RNase YbeY [bacterium]
MRLISVDRLAAGPGWRPAVRRLAELEAMIAQLGRPDWQVELVWAADEEMTALNVRWRGREGVTDVLSFSNLGTRGEGDPALPAGACGAATDLWWEDGPAPPGLLAGEIVIAPRFVQRRCADEGWDFDDELALLVTHGVLHVLGWEHDSPGRTEAMREL